MKRFTNILILIVVAGCASTPTPPVSTDKWTYIGNDPEGTENILMSDTSATAKNGALTTTFRYQYTAPRSINNKQGKTVSYVEQRNQVRVNCLEQRLQILDTSYYDVDNNRIEQTKQAGQADTGSDQRVVPGGISDIMYQAVCGRSIGWENVGSSDDGNQKIYILGKAAQKPLASITEAWFKTEYRGSQSLIAAPSMQHVSYASKISTLQLDCATYELHLLHEVYYDSDGHKVFDIQPAAGEAQTLTATADSVRGTMYRAACGQRTKLRYLGTDPHGTQKIYLIGSPELDKQQIARARFHIYYIKPGTLTMGPVIHTVAYTARSLEIDADCASLTYQILNETYLNNRGMPVFTITPSETDAPNIGVANGSLSEMLWETACHDAH